MKKILLLTLLIIPAMAFTQKLNQKTTDEKKGNEMLIGYCNREGFAKVNSNFDSAYKAEYALYKPDDEILKQLDEKLKDIKVTIVMATWCSDSKEWVPRFYKIMDQLNFNYKKLTLICVDRTKKARTPMWMPLKWILFQLVKVYSEANLATPDINLYLD
ncbi:MAG: hypothetical protein U0Z17_11995 [Bacteroidales bacterium]